MRTPAVKHLTIPPPHINLIKNCLDDITKLRTAGYKKQLTFVEDAIEDYVQNYLQKNVYLGKL